MTSSTELIDQKLGAILKEVSAVRKNTFLSTAANLNPWENFSHTTNSSAGSRVRGLRQSWLSNFGFDDSTSICMLTGTKGKTNLTLAHIIPLNIRKACLKDVNMVDKLNDFRNLMMLCKSVEKALDQREVSIIRSGNILRENEYVLKVWNYSKCAKTPIIEGSRKMISEYNGTILNFVVPLNGPYRPFKRALSYHNFWCFIHWSKFNGDYSAGAEPLESSSETSISSDWLAQKKGLLEDLHHYLNIEEREENDDEQVEDDEEVWEDDIEEGKFGEDGASNGFEDNDLGAARCESEEGFGLKAIA